MTVAKTYRERQGQKVIVYLTLSYHFIKHGCKAVPPGGFKGQPSHKGKVMPQANQNPRVDQQISNPAICPGRANSGYQLDRKPNFICLVQVKTNGKTHDISIFEIWI